MESADNFCARCGRTLAANEKRRVPEWIVIAASVALAFLHGGMWARETLTQTYCARCRNIVTAAALFGGSILLTAASIGVGLMIRGWRS